MLLLPLVVIGVVIACVLLVTACCLVAGQKSGLFGCCARTTRGACQGTMICCKLLMYCLVVVFLVVYVVDHAMRQRLIWTNFEGYEFLRENVTLAWRNNGDPAPIVQG